MNRSILALVFASLVVGPLTSAEAAVETYDIDPVHTWVGFTIAHFFTKVPGYFGKLKGTIVVLLPADVHLGVHEPCLRVHVERREGVGNRCRCELRRLPGRWLRGRALHYEFLCDRLHGDDPLPTDHSQRGMPTLAKRHFQLRISGMPL